MGLYNFSDQIVFKILRDIEHGYLEITKYNGELLKFGNPNSPLKSVLKIKKPNFTFNLIKGGMPAKYGGRLASVLDISMKEGNSKKFEIDGGIGLISSKLTVQGLLKKILVPLSFLVEELT